MSHKSPCQGKSTYRARPQPAYVSNPQNRRRTSSLSAIPFAPSRSSSIRSFSGDGHGVESEVDRCAMELFGRSTALTDVPSSTTYCRTHYRPRKPELERARVRRIVYSSSSDSEEAPPRPGPRHGNADADDVIEITDSSDDDDDDRPSGPMPPSALQSTPEQRQYDGFDDDGLLVL